jgi:hypothetical protein
MTPERKAELRAEIETFLGPLPTPKPAAAPKPKVGIVASEGRVIRDVDVIVSRADPNAQRGDTMIHVRRADRVTINMAEVQRQYWLRVQDRGADVARRRQLDPFGYGHWGRFDD